MFLIEHLDEVIGRNGNLLFEINISTLKLVLRPQVSSLRSYSTIFMNINQEI